jgi:aromatic ring-opening dioxygenase catalytic subunit (LigB family)
MSTTDDPSDLTRRSTIVAGIVGTAALAATAKEKKMTHERMPIVYLPHGGGPWPWLSDPVGDPDELSELTAYLKSIARLPKTAPKALLMISAHWEEPVPTVMSAARPPMLYDYSGFPPETYSIQWPAPGAPELGTRVRELLRAAGIDSAADGKRGFDHGTFVPLKLAYPEANVPTLQLSLKHGLDPAEHLAIGRALAPLRDEGVFIVGSGMTYHNLRAFGPQSAPVAAAFDAWLQQSVPLPQAERDAALAQWTQAPAARQAHPREEHLIPLMVTAGAAGADRATVAYSNSIRGLKISAYQFG